MGRFCSKMGGCPTFLSKNGWERVVFLQKWVRGSPFLKTGGSELFLLKNGWEWVGVAEVMRCG